MQMYFFHPHFAFRLAEKHEYTLGLHPDTTRDFLFIFIFAFPKPELDRFDLI